MAILVVGGNSRKVLPLQPIAAHSYMAILVVGGNSRKVLPLQPIAAHSYMAISVMGGNSSKVLPLQPNSYIILPPLNKLPPHSYINLPPIDKLPPPPPPLLHQNGRILGRTFDPGTHKLLFASVNPQVQRTMDHLPQHINIHDLGAPTLISISVPSISRKLQPSSRLALISIRKITYTIHLIIFTLWKAESTTNHSSWRIH